MFKEAFDAMARAARDPGQRLVALAVACALTLGGVTRSFLEMSVGGVGSFPMPGDNLLMLVLCALVCAPVALFHRSAARFLRSLLGRAVVALFALGSVALLEASRLMPAQTGARVLFFAGALVRMASLVLLVALYVRVSPLEAGACVAQVVWGLLVSIALDVVFLLLAPVGVAVVGFALPAVAWLVLGALDRREAVVGADACGATPNLPRASATGGGVRPGNLPVARLAVFCLYGIVSGMASSQAYALAADAIAEPPSMVWSCLVNDAGLVLGVLVLLVGTFWLARRLVEAFALRYLLVPTFLVAIFLAPLLTGMMGALVPLLMAFAQALFYGLLWVFPRLAPAGGHLRWFAAGCGAFFTGTYAGMWVGGDLLPVSSSGDVYMVLAALALAALLMVEFAPRLLAPRVDESVKAAEVLVAHRTSGGLVVPAGEAGASRPAPVDPNAGIDALAARAAQAWGLTPRERAVLPGLLRGRSVAWVAESLTVSKNTVHTHMRNIYQKAGVHSQEELIDAAEAL